MQLKGEDEPQSSAAKILSAAASLLAQDGYEGLSMRKIAKVVGISQAAIYRHYKDKDELVGKLVASGYASLMERVLAFANETKPVPEILGRAIEAYADFAQENPGLFSALLLKDIGPTGRAVEALRPGLAGERRSFAALAAILSRGMSEGSVMHGDPEVLAQAVWTAMFGLAARLVIEKTADRRRRDEIVAAQISIIVKGLRP